jgi:hypothetical protein
LGAPFVPLPKDRIDQIAAATEVASSDRSKSLWKQNQRANKEEEALQKNFNRAINKAYELTTPSTTLARNA